MTDLTIIGLAMIGSALASVVPLWLYAMRDTARRADSRRQGHPDSGQRPTH